MKGPIRSEEESVKAELSGEIMKRNTVERAIKTEIDTRTGFFKKKSGQARLVYVKNINHTIPVT